MFEILTLMQTEKLAKQIQIILYGTDYWDPILNLEPMAEWGAISDDDLHLLQRANTPQEAFELLKAHLTLHHLTPATPQEMKAPGIAKTTVVKQTGPRPDSEAGSVEQERLRAAARNASSSACQSAAISCARHARLDLAAAACRSPARMSIGSFVVLVLVRRLPPRELSPDRAAGTWRSARRPVSTGRNASRSVTWIWQPPHGCFACFWNVGSNTAGRKYTPGSSSAFISPRKALGVDPRRADQLERPRRAAALREHRAFEQHRARVDDRRVERRHVRRRHHPRQSASRRHTSRAASPPSSRPRASAPMPKRSLNSVASSPIVIPCRIGIGNWPTNDSKPRCEHGALDVDAADRVRPVAHDHRHAVPRRSAAGSWPSCRCRCRCGRRCPADR